MTNNMYLNMNVNNKNYFYYRASNGRNKSNSNSESSSRPGTRGRFGNSSRGKAQDQTDETQQDEVQVKNKSYHRG